MWERLTADQEHGPSDETTAPGATVIPSERQAHQLRQIIQIATYRKRQILERMLMD